MAGSSALVYMYILLYVHRSTGTCKVAMCKRTMILVHVISIYMYILYARMCMYIVHVYYVG